MITVITVGKKHEDWVSGGIKRYQTRCKQPWNFEWQLIPHSKLDGQQARQEESERILARLHTQDFIILLDERGQMFDSPTLSCQLNELFAQGKNITIVIGGAFGVSTALIQRANLVWSLSPLVFPHQLVRLILAEQLYRAQEIARGSRYHHQ